MKIFKMRPAIALGALLLASSMAQAAQINFTTTGSFDGGSNVKAVGPGTLTFESASGPVFANPFTFASWEQSGPQGLQALRTLPERR